MADHLTPLVSIVTPSYNQGGFIEDTIQSVLNQTYPNIEYWVIDAGSTDQTVEVLKKYSDRVQWISEKDRGQSDAINKGWKRCTGVYFSWLNSDDYLEPTAVEKIVEQFLARPETAIVYGDLDVVDQNKNFLQKAVVEPFDFDRFLFANTIGQPNAFVAKWALDQVGLVDESLRYGMDYDLWWRIVPYYPALYIPEKIAYFRFHDQSKTIQELQKFAPEYLKVITRLGKIDAVPASKRSVYRKALAYIHVNTGFFFINQGKYREAFPHFVTAVTHNPHYLKNRGIVASLLWGMIGNRGMSWLKKLSPERSPQGTQSSSELTFPKIPGLYS